jgi:hypothetical protein
LEYEKKLREKVKNMKFSFESISPYRKFKAIAISIANMFFLLRVVRRFKKQAVLLRKEEQVAIYAVNHALYRDWIIRSFKTFFTRLLNYETDSFDITGYSPGEGDKSVYEKRAKRLVHSTVYFLK